MKPFFLWALFSLLLMEAFTSRAAGELDQARFSWAKLGSGEAHTLGSGSAYFFLIEVNPALANQANGPACPSGGSIPKGSLPMGFKYSEENELASPVPRIN